MTGRLRWLWLGCALLVLALAGLTVHASLRRQRAAAAVRKRVAVARALGMPDLVLSSTSRWLRHPSQTEPAAPFADAPASLDTDPAGAVLGPPRRPLARTEEDARLVPRRGGRRGGDPR